MAELMDMVAPYLTWLKVEKRWCYLYEDPMEIESLYEPDKEYYDLIKWEVENNPPADVSILDFYKKEMVKIIKFDPEKNYTDFELILHEIERYQKDNNIIFDNVYVLGGLGKRLDMTLNNINLSVKNGRKNRGVYQKNKGKWYASIQWKNKVYCSPVFETLEEACFARYILEQEIVPEYIIPHNLEEISRLSQEQKDNIIEVLNNKFS